MTMGTVFAAWDGGPGPGSGSCTESTHRHRGAAVSHNVAPTTNTDTLRTTGRDRTSLTLRRPRLCKKLEHPILGGTPFDYPGVLMSRKVFFLSASSNFVIFNWWYFGTYSRFFPP